MRARSEQLSKEIDPQTAEQLIMYSLGKGSIDGLDSRVRHLTQFGLLAALVLGEQFDDSGLEEFLAEARKIADQWIS
ncbi:MAG: hypothetical protein ACRDOO_17105 [Actinomadura sp.]